MVEAIDARRRRGFITIMVVAAALSGCATSYEPIEQLAICDDGACTQDLSGEDNGELRRQIFEFFGYSSDAVGEPAHELQFREADLEARRCRDDETGIRIIAVPLYLIPGFLNLKRIQLHDYQADGDALSATLTPVSTFTGIPPLCQDAALSISVSKGGQTTFETSWIYCNWLAVGNVIVQTQFSFDFFDFSRGVAGGAYEMRLNGTAKGAGSGFFISAPAETDHLSAESARASLSEASANLNPPIGRGVSR